MEIVDTLYRTFRITGQGVRLSGEIKRKRNRKETDNPAACERRGMKVPLVTWA